MKLLEVLPCVAGVKMSTQSVWTRTQPFVHDNTNKISFNTIRNVFHERDLHNVLLYKT